MKIVFASTHGYLPDIAGGSESSTHELCLSLQEQGMECGVLAKWAGPSAGGDRTHAQGAVPAYPADYGLGYPVYRGVDPVKGVEAVCSDFQPDIAVIQAGKSLLLAAEFLRQSIKTVVYVRNVEFQWHGGDYKAHPLCHYIANSQFTADTFHKAFGLDAKVIPPLVRPERYAVDTTRQKVLFVGPSPLKGVEIAFQLAQANPDIPFLFVESWPLSPEEQQGYLARARLSPNISWLPRQMDMRPVYAQAKILLVPSVWNEAWGRVVTEAQASGIPALASQRGGLPESVGAGGIVLDPAADIGLWHQALNSLWYDEGVYHRYSQAALAHAGRAAIQPQHLLAEFIGFLRGL